jgi:hypothetical protein
MIQDSSKINNTDENRVNLLKLDFTLNKLKKYIYRKADYCDLRGPFSSGRKKAQNGI